MSLKLCLFLLDVISTTDTEGGTKKNTMYTQRHGKEKLFKGSNR